MAYVFFINVCASLIESLDSFVRLISETLWQTDLKFLLRTIPKLYLLTYFSTPDYPNLKITLYNQGRQIEGVDCKVNNEFPFLLETIM